MTKEKYVETVLRAIEDCSKEDLDSVVKLILAIDRRNGPEVAMETVLFADKYRKASNGVVVGIDLSGDPSVSTKYICIIITEHESLHQKKQFDWTLRCHMTLKTATFTFNKRSFFGVKVTLPGNRC